ncbi:hypothetical protein BKA69DRAFT_1179247 [Paraphysoderma sedebokerense]|nr:hypothetical protein BKA69DRAFT_1179247 [Paraphysoderma sedebokerense]
MKLQWKSRNTFAAMAITTFLYFFFIYSSLLRPSDFLDALTPKNECQIPPVAVRGSITSEHSNTRSQTILYSLTPQLSSDFPNTHTAIWPTAIPSRTDVISNSLTSLELLNPPSLPPEIPSSSTNSPLATAEPKLCGEPSPSTKILLDASKRPVTEETLPLWIQNLCPEVAVHFSRFPYFAKFTKMPVMTTSYAAHSVCAVKVAGAIAAAANANIYLHAGSHLGAILHGGPIPWDDDVDMFLPYTKKDEFLSRCSQLSDLHPHVSLECIVAFNAIKFSIVSADSAVTNQRWKSPFVDIFLFQVNKGSIQEVDPNGSSLGQSYRLQDYFPTRPFYFGGVYMIGPSEAISLQRYNASLCKAGRFNHRLELFASYNGSYLVDCCHLSNRFPFVYDHSFVFDGKTTHALMDPIAYDYTFAWETWYIPESQRNEWFKRDEIEGDYLSGLLPNASIVEVDNTLSKCQDKPTLTVVEFNAARGSLWHYSVDILKNLNADVIILNEMDIGMARSDQQHTTRLLAFALGMNYAWGLEFLELTRGDRQEQNLTEGMTNLLGLHGNAILSKCEILDPVIFRNKIGGYFSDKKYFLNADGFEKRLGGRMGLFSRIAVGHRVLTVGSIHKLDGYKTEIKAYIGSSKAVIAGDQSWDFCESVGLAHVDDKSHFTYPGSCQTSGTSRGDIICSNANIVQAESTVKPCLEQYGVKIKLSDHSITSVGISIV